MADPAEKVFSAQLSSETTNAQDMKGSSLAGALVAALALPGAVAQFNANGEHTDLRTAVGVWCDDSANAYANAIASHGDINTWITT